RHHGFLFGDDVAPDLAVGQLQFTFHRTIGIDVIAGMDEEVRTIVEHGPVGTHPAARRIDAPALARSIARPHERNMAPRGGRGTKMPDLHLAFDAALADIVETHAIENE